MVSEHASPLAVLGGVDAGGQNVHVAALAVFPDDGEINRMPRGAALVGNGKLGSAHLTTNLSFPVEGRLWREMLDKQ